MKNRETQSSAELDCKVLIHRRRAIARHVVSRLCPALVPTFFARRPTQERDMRLWKHGSYQTICAAAAAAAEPVVSQAIHSAHEEKQAMKAAMAKAKAGQVSEGTASNESMHTVTVDAARIPCCKAISASANSLSFPSEFLPSV
jgi:hypothetical protein